MIKKTILITGINGFLGSHLAKQLSSDFNIIGLEYNTDNLFRLKESSFKVYASEKEGLEKIFNENNIYAVIHAATIYKRENEPYKKLLETNINLPVQLLELSQKLDVSMFLNTDSYFNHPDSNYSYLADYSLSKKHALEWLKVIKGPCQLINMKLFHIYGPDDSINKFVPTIIKSLKNNKDYIDLTLGEQKKDFIFVKDVVNAYKQILNNFRIHNEKILEFEIGTGKSISIKDFVCLIKNISKSTTELRFGILPYRENEMMDVVSDNSKLQSIGWKQQYTLSEGLSETINSIS